MEPLNIAYLGPSGTWTELALQAFLPDCQRTPAHSLGEVFKLVKEEKADAGFLPVENIIEGPVTESLDLLRDFANDIQIVNSFNFSIEHALGIPPRANYSLEQVKAVYSRSQALRQCARNLDELCPLAKRVPTESTANAIELVVKSAIPYSAVVAPLSTLQSAGFQIVNPNICSFNDNKTRFLMIARSGAKFTNQEPDQAFPNSITEGLTRQYVTSICVNPGRDRKALLFELLDTISVKHKVNLISIHSRPDARGGSVFHLDLEGSLRNPAICSCLKEIERYCLEHTGSTAELKIFGSYPYQPFHCETLKRACVIGSEGRMGKWFCKFLSNAGMEVCGFDKNSSCSLKEAVSEADMILISIPMSAIDTLTPELSTVISPGQLVVENCSIKSAALPQLQKIIPDEVELLGIHTMFGGDIVDLRGENIIVVKTKRSASKAQEFEDMLYKFGANLLQTSLKEHDKISALLQSSFQLMLIAVAETVKKEFQSFDNIKPYSTPNSRLIEKSIRKVMKQDSALLVDLQTMNPFASAVRKKLLESFANLVFALENEDTETLLETIAQAKIITNKDV